MNLLLLFGGVTLCLAWLIAGHYYPWANAQQEILAVVGALLLGGAALFAKRFFWPFLAVVAATAATIPLLQWGAGQIRFVSDAVVAAGYLAGFAMCIVVGATLARERQVDMSGLVLSALGVAAMVSVGMGLKQWVDQGTGVFIDSVQLSGRIYANFAQPNHLATALAIGTCAVLLGHARGKLGSFVTVLAITFLSWGLVMTQSRTGWLFVALMAVGLLALRRRAALKISPSAVVAGVALFALAALSWSPLNDLLLLSRQDAAMARLSSGSLRLIHWQVILDAISQHPWSGYGWTQTALAQQATVAGHPATGEMLTNSHNLALDLLAWNGIPLGLFLVGCLVWWFVRQLRQCVDAERAFPLAAVGAVMLHSLLEFPLDYAYFLLPTGLLMGALDAKDPKAPSVTTSRTLFAVPFVVLLTLSTWIGYEFFWKVVDTSRTLRFVAAGIGTDKVPRVAEPDVILLDRIRELHRFILAPARIDPDPAYLAWVRDVAQRHAFPPAMLRHALAAGLNHQPAEAEQVLVRICKMHPVGSCDEGRTSWALLKQEHPELASIPYPQSEPAPAATLTR